MSQENVEIVRRIYEASARRDAETVMALYDPDVEWDGSRHRWAEIMDGEAKWRGHDALRTFFRRYHEMWKDFEYDIDELLDTGERVVSVVTSRARGRSSGVVVEWTDQVGLWTIRDGRVVHVAWLPSREEALEAAGLSE
jgi:ketosteroid isomerase-like protein